MSGACMAIRREVYERLGPLDEDYAIYAQDLDYCLRAADSGWQVRVVPAWRVVHHHGATIGAARRDDRLSATGECTTERENLSLLWSDLWTWARKRRHRAWALGAFYTLQVGGFLRLGTLACGRWLSTDHPARLRYVREMLRVREALRSLSSRRSTASRSRASRTSK